MYSIYACALVKARLVLMKVAKIITTSFVPKAVRETSELCGNPLGFFSHSQNFPSKESVVDLLKFVINKEKKCDPGCNTDLIIVNNDTGWQKGIDYLDAVNQGRLKRGVIRVFHRENFGRSFGGYNFAFKKLKDEYDYFIFTEDDTVVSVDGYASIGIDIFNKTENCGFVAYEGVSNKSIFKLADGILVDDAVIGTKSRGPVLANGDRSIAPFQRAARRQLADSAIYGCRTLNLLQFQIIMNRLWVDGTINPR